MEYGNATRLESTCHSLCISSSPCSTTIDVWSHVMYFLTIFVSDNGSFSSSSIGSENNTILNVYKDLLEYIQGRAKAEASFRG